MIGSSCVLMSQPGLNSANDMQAWREIRKTTQNDFFNEDLTKKRTPDV